MDICLISSLFSCHWTSTSLLRWRCVRTDLQTGIIWCFTVAEVIHCANQKLPNQVVHSDQIGHKCNQIFTDAIIFKHALAICDWKIRQLIAKLQYCDNHKSFKSYIQTCIWLFEQAWKLRKTTKRQPISLW